MNDSSLDSDERAAASYPGARLPDRRRTVKSFGVDLCVSEWGDERAPVIFCSHGGFDFTGTFDVFAPLLAAGGYRVVVWDQRGHGDSGHAPLYSWDADVRDLLTALDSTTREPAILLGHSKGGSISTYAIQAAPHRVRAFVNIDGMPSHRPPPDVADHERTKLLATELSGWLDHRRAAGDKVRRADTLGGLAERRARQNPRLSKAWLRYLVTRGARKDADGWRWKIDPVLRPGGFGPWRATWSMARLASLPVPLLGLLATESEPMGWETRASEVKPYLPRRAEVVEMKGVGHFIHIEQPERTAKLVLDFLRNLA
ncbi:MAG: alpha/beta hydrolase [Deltaproteobacteria bacterium]|nr:alpha/beta hydrolase [Deltaproteobacteria bacterium]